MTIEPSQRSNVRDDRGAIMVIALFFAVFLVALLFSVVGTGRAIFVREHLQDSTDSAVLSGAILNAQGMNLIVLANVVMAALLAILVALKAIEGLCIIGIAICAALAWLTAGATLSAIPTLNDVRDNTRTVHDELKDVIFPAIESLHSISDTVKEITPELAKAGAEARLLSEGQYPADTGVVFGKAVVLPVEDDEYDVLCGKAGEAVCMVVMKPFAGINQDVTSGLESACKGFAKSLSNWFCDDQSGGGGSSDFPINRKQDMLYPRMTQTKNCEKGDKNACQWLQDAAPNKTGFCQKNDDCSAYETFVAAAREQCEPTQEKKPEKYSYQLHTTSVVYTWSGRVWQRGEPRRGQYESVFGSKTPPCVGASNQAGFVGLGLAAVAPGYQMTVHPGGDVKQVNPVCTTEARPAIVPGLVKNDTRKVSYKEVTQILGCSRTEDYQVPLKKNAEERARDKDDKSPKTIVSKTKLGQETFLLRAIAKRSSKDDAIKKIVDLARWGKKVDDTGFTRMLWLSSYSYAQAEYFYDDKSGSGSWMWNMKWKARLCRFSAPSTTKETAKLTALCVGATGGRCVDLITKFFVTDLAAH